MPRRYQNYKLTNNFQPNSVTGADNKGSPLSHLLTAGSASTLNGGDKEEKAANCGKEVSQDKKAFLLKVHLFFLSSFTTIET